MKYLGALLNRLNRRKVRIVLLTAALVSTLAAPVVASAADAEGLQKQGIQKVNQYLDYMRRTGDVTSMLPELLRAQAQLRLSADAFLAEQNPAGAALSFLKLGDIERWQNHWDAARSLYSRALELASRRAMPSIRLRRSPS